MSKRENEEKQTKSESSRKWRSEPEGNRKSSNESKRDFSRNKNWKMRERLRGFSNFSRKKKDSGNSKLTKN